jgi:hypothetical protein
MNLSTATSSFELSGVKETYSKVLQNFFYGKSLRIYLTLIYCTILVENQTGLVFSKAIVQRGGGDPLVYSIGIV